MAQGVNLIGENHHGRSFRVIYACARNDERPADGQQAGVGRRSGLHFFSINKMPQFCVRPLTVLRSRGSNCRLRPAPVTIASSQTRVANYCKRNHLLPRTHAHTVCPVKKCIGAHGLGHPLPPGAVLLVVVIVSITTTTITTSSAVRRRRRRSLGHRLRSQPTNAARAA